jgi:hypothetical protein
MLRAADSDSGRVGGGGLSLPRVPRAQPGQPMTRVGVLVTRRFITRAQRQDHVTEARRAVELPFAPSPGMILAFDDGSGECVVSKIRLRVQTAGRLGLLPVEVEAIGCQEAAAGLEAALAAGWQAETGTAATFRVASAPAAEAHAQ